LILDTLRTALFALVLPAVAAQNSPKSKRLARQEALAERFQEATGHEVEVIPVTESDLGTRATAAFAAGDLPDVIYHTLQYALPWAEAGILDTDAATDVIVAGHGDLRPRRAGMAAYEGGYASVPVDGWTQMIVYRADLFDEAGLEPPTTYANVLAAVEALHNPPEMYGFVAATKVDENFMSQVLEHVFLANGVSPGRPRRVPAARRGRDHRGAGILQGHRRSLASGRALLGSVAHALLLGQRGDDHLVALHPR
jgi:multiple sugar transport system substrate-binding protein